MTLPIAFGVYFICWWLAFFMVLPIGNRIRADGNAGEEGFADSAPENPRILWKALLATMISAMLFAAVYAVIAYRLIPLDSIPMGL